MRDSKDDMPPHRAILIAGPTASGKSALALRMAQLSGGVVINADSMQVYRDLHILTARPGPADLAAARHELYGYVAGNEPYSVGRWLSDAETVMRACWQEGRLPIVTGGTGLYFKALLEGLSPIPAIPAEIREHWRGQARRLGPQALHALLAARDPETAALLRPSDPQRLTRALEVLAATGRPLAAWLREPGKPILDQAEALCLVVAPPRPVLQARADARFRGMMAAGALEEARALGAMGYAPDLPVMRALGVASLLVACRSEMALEMAIARAILDTRQYIKRQQTWLNRNMIAWNSINAQDSEINASEIFTLVRR